jgi:RND family efflux transporter MFP subunit
MQIVTRVALPLGMGALGCALVLLLGGSVGAPARSPLLAGDTTGARPPAKAETMLMPASVPGRGPTPDGSRANLLEVSGKSRPSPGRRALIAPVPLHPVTEVRVKPGDRVKKEQVLVKLDDDEPRAEVRAKQAALEQTRVALKEARRFLNVAEDLASRGHLPEQQLHGARVAMLKAEQDELAAKAALESSQAELEHYTVTAPIDGVITWLAVVPGTVSRPGTTVWGEILDLSEIDVVCELNAEQADRISLGQAVEVRREGQQQPRWAGEVVFVAPAADERTGLVPVRVGIKSTGGRLRCHIEVKVRFSSGPSTAPVAGSRGAR